MVAVQAGEGVRLRFRAETSSGQVIRPPAMAVVTFSSGGFAQGAQASLPEWDGRQWVVLVDTTGWEPGSYTAVAEVSGLEGRGLGEAEITVTAP